MSNETEILNAKITDTKLGEEHGCLTAKLFLEGDGWGCGFGGYCLDYWFARPGRKAGEYKSSDGYGAIIELMKALGVDSWERLKGQLVRVETQGWGGHIVRIGHIMKDQWFSFQTYYEAVKMAQNVRSDENDS